VSALCWQEQHSNDSIGGMGNTEMNIQMSIGGMGKYRDEHVEYTEPAQLCQR
jgi:hypothetical protein